MDIVRSVGRPQSVTPFSFLLFLYFFRAFYQSHRNCPIMDSNQRGVHHILLFSFCRSTFSIPYTQLQHWLLSLPVQPPRFHPTIVDFNKTLRSIILALHLHP